MCSVFSSSVIFSLPLILTLVVASISHFFTAAIKFPCFSSKKWSSLFLISRSSSLSVKIWLLRSKRERESPGKVVAKPNFLTHGATLRARESFAIMKNIYPSW